MNPKGQKLQPKLALAMPFQEALQRFCEATPISMPQRDTTNGKHHRRKRKRLSPTGR
jgi:hypothetical protein